MSWSGLYSAELVSTFTCWLEDNPEPVEGICKSFTLGGKPHSSANHMPSLACKTPRVRQQKVLAQGKRFETAFFFFHMNIQVKTDPRWATGACGNSKQYDTAETVK